jgi:hypothetical protein
MLLAEETDRMTRATFISISLTMLCTAVLIAREGVVKLNDGRTLTGDVREADGNVTINIRGVKTTLARSDVASITYGADAEKEFNDRLARLESNDAKGRIELARWAFDQEKYELSRKALDEAIAIDPNDADAATLMATVRSQMRLQRSKEASTRPEPEQPGATAPSTQPATTRAATARATLSPDDINTIRQAELLADHTQVRLQFLNDVRKRFATQENMTVQQFNSLPPLTQAGRILERGDASMKSDVRVQSDPRALFDFRRLIQPAVLANCATSGCHGGGQGAGGLWILNPADNDASVYTNFYLLQSYRKERPGGNAVFGGGDLRLIDRTHPEDSLLLNFGLPASVARFDHPDVQGYRPAFRNAQDQGYVRIFNWIAQALKPVEPDYGITFDGAAKPTTAAATAPTTQPTSARGDTAPAGALR